MNAELNKILGSYAEKRVGVIGVGVSNYPLIKLLCEHGIHVTACDARESLGEQGEELAKLGVELKLGKDYLEELDFDIIFRTPGLLPTSPALVRAAENGAVITSEMELFFEVCPCTMIAVTGSDGKTTTTTLISELLKAEGKNVYVGGNIGHPLLADSRIMTPEDYVVVELSSFQLMGMKKSAHIAVVTNVTPNHLDKHTDMQEYIDAKKNVFLGQNSPDILVTNMDNDISAGFAGLARGELRGFTRASRVENGVFCENGVIYLVSAEGTAPVLNVGDIRIPGWHNVENYMAAIAAVKDIVSVETIKRVAMSFAGVAHRIEFVRELDGVRYYNDSIASSPTRTIAGLKSFDEKVILIAGGYDKHIPFDELGPEIIGHVSHLVLTGATAGKIAEAVNAAGDVSMELVDDFEEAVRAAAKAAIAGDTVLFSPACASFDKFKNFEERGDFFKKIVASL